MRIEAVFRYLEEEDRGVWGLRPLAHPEFDAAQGMAVAHDLLEHLPNSGRWFGREYLPAIADEMMAFGAIYWMRAEPGYWHMLGKARPDPVIQMGSDWPSIYERFGEHPTDPNDLISFPGVVEHDRTYEELVAIAERGGRNVIDECELEGEAAAAWVDAGFLYRQADWMRFGYHKTVTRYRHQSQHHMMSLFLDTERGVDAWLAKAGDGTMVPHGVKVRLRVDTIRHEVSLRWYNDDTRRWQEIDE